MKPESQIPSSMPTKLELEVFPSAPAAFSVARQEYTWSCPYCNGAAGRSGEWLEAGQRIYDCSWSGCHMRYVVTAMRTPDNQ